MEWLDRNPVQDEVDIAFLLKEVQRLRAALEKWTQEQQQQAMNAVDGNRSNGIVCVSGGRGHWRGCVPYLCIICCLTQDNVKCLFLIQANSDCVSN
jgi:hypothetical protein